MLAAIRQWVIKTMTKGQTGVVTTMPKPQLIEMNVQITAERLMRNGINPGDLKTVGQVENVINQIDTPKVNVNPGVTKVKEADVMDMKGNKIDTSKGIMGGEEIKPIDELQNYTKSKEDIVQDLVDQKFGKGYFDTVDESEAAIKARIEADNKKGIASMKKKLDDPEEKADGGRIGLLAGTVPKVLKLLKNKKKVQAAVDDIFPTGDYKYDAQMAADSLVENNPNTFGGKLYEDLDQDTQMEIYSTVLQPITNRMATQMKLQRATKPEKTLQSMKEGKGIDMSDPGISEEFTRFMKETDPEGYKKLEQTVELSNFKTKGRKENSDGGRIGLKGGAFLNFIKNLGKGINNKSPLQAYKDYLRSVKERTLKANETGKFTDLPLETIPVAASGGLLTSYLKKKMKAMDEEQKAKVEKKAKGGRIGFKGGADFATVADSKGNVGAKSVSVSPSGSVTTSRTRGPDGPDDRSNFTQNVNHREAMRNYQRPAESKIKKAIETGSEISFLNNLYKMNPVGLGLNIGGKMLYNKFFDDQAMLDTEDEGIMQMAELNPLGLTQMRNLEKKKAMEPLGGDPFTDKDQEMLDELKRRDADPDKTYGPVLAAKGGRIGYKAGSVDKIRRLFLKTIGAGTAGIAGAKSGIFSFGKGPAKEVAKEVAQQTTTSTPPPYFFKLAEKIKKLGKDTTPTNDRTIAKSLKSKDGTADYILEEDMVTGDIQIKKVNMENDNMINDIEIMEFRKGEDVITKEGKAIKTPPEYDEVTESYSRIYKDDYNAPDYQDGIRVDEIIKEVDDKVPSIKYATGGLAYMLGE